ncbi:MAG: DEAD/DEAH box helicase [Acidobacteria bacterium]|nr:DEAD/DEAH box helicase [Acidobacteriota bacterium]
MQKGSSEPLPIDDHLADIVGLLRQHRAVVVTAAPGAGKTTRVPPALTGDGPVLLLQPRRVAARAIAQRIATEQGWTVGREVGWHVRFDRRDSRDTRLLVATEGILTARLQQDPLLSDFRTVVLDEFHERSIHSDLGLALTKQAWLARDDLRIVVMSATLDARVVSAFLDGCPVVEVPGRLFPVEISYRPGAVLEDVVTAEISGTDGAILVFLPGAGEIARAATALRPRLGPDVGTFELHGGLAAEDQDAALRPATRSRVILATNIAETTLTVPDVRMVIDTGWQKVARYDAGRGIDSLEPERVSRDAADQRAGRAGRLAPGRAIRLWDEHARLKAHRQPDIARVDLASPVLDLLAWGANPRSFEWFEAPRPDMLEAALSLLRRLDAVDAEGHLTPSGRQLQRLPLHPRLARLLVAAAGAPEAARAVALLSDRRRQTATATAASCDLWSATHGTMLPATNRVARDVRAVLRANSSETLSEATTEDAFRRAVFAAYPDRLGRRRSPGSDRVLLATGTGARLGRESGVVHHEYLVAIDVGTNSADPSGEATIRMACGIEREWISPTSVSVEHRFDRDAGRVRARRVARYDAIELSSTDVPADPLESGRLLTAAILAQGPREADRQLLTRCGVAGVDTSFEALVRAAALSARTFDEVRLADGLAPHLAQRLSRDAPVDLPLPSGRRATLDYREDGRVVAAVKLQELFGLADTPRIGPSGIPVTFELLAPNGRPVQVTADLRSFWTTGYQEVRRELRARYPRHPWPEDPWTARPTHRTVRRG